MVERYNELSKKNRFQSVPFAALRLSPDNKNTNSHYRKMILTKKNILGMLNIFYTLSEKMDFFRGRGVDRPPLMADMSAKKSRFLTPSLIYELSKNFLSFKWNGRFYTSTLGLLTVSLTDSYVRIVLLYPIWSLSPGSGLVGEYRGLYFFKNIPKN